MNQTLDCVFVRSDIIVCKASSVDKEFWLASVISQENDTLRIHWYDQQTNKPNTFDPLREESKTPVATVLANLSQEKTLPAKLFHKSRRAIVLLPSALALIDSLLELEFTPHPNLAAVSVSTQNTRTNLTLPAVNESVQVETQTVLREMFAMGQHCRPVLNVLQHVFKSENFLHTLQVERCILRRIHRLVALERNIIFVSRSEHVVDGLTYVYMRGLESPALPSCIAQLPQLDNGRCLVEPILTQELFDAATRIQVASTSRLSKLTLAIDSCLSKHLPGPTSTFDYVCLVVSLYRPNRQPLLTSLGNNISSPLAIQVTGLLKKLLAAPPTESSSGLSLWDKVPLDSTSTIRQQMKFLSCLPSHVLIPALSHHNETTADRSFRQSARTCMLWNTHYDHFLEGLAKVNTSLSTLDQDLSAVESDIDMDMGLPEVASEMIEPPSRGVVSQDEFQFPSGVVIAPIPDLKIPDGREEVEITIPPDDLFCHAFVERGIVRCIANTVSCLTFLWNGKSRYFFSHFVFDTDLFFVSTQIANI